MKRGELYWADLPEPYGRRPAVVVTRGHAVRLLTAVTIAPVTRTVRDVESEVPVGRDEGLRDISVVSCDSLYTVAKEHIDRRPVGRLSRDKVRRLDLALVYALGVSDWPT